MERARVAASALPYPKLHRGRDRSRDRTDRALNAIDLAAVVVLGTGLVTAFLGR